MNNGNNKITSEYIANLAGVSQSTVSFVLNNRTDIYISQETRERVLKIAKQLNYGPFRQAGYLGEPNNIAVFLPSFDNPYYSMLLAIINEKLSANGYRCLLFCTNKSQKKEIEYLKTLDSPDIKAVLYTFTPQSKTAVCDFAKKKSLYIIGEVDYNIKATVIALNSKRAGYIALEHLYNLGHRHVAYISNSINALSNSRRKRYEGIMEFAQQNNIFENIKLLTIDSDADKESDFEVGYKFAKAVIKDKRYTAIIAANDSTAIGAINALLESGINVPNDISVMGFDNIPLSNAYYPKITTIDHSLDVRVDLTVDLLNDNKHNNQTFYISYEPILILRDSTKLAAQTATT